MATQATSVSVSGNFTLTDSTGSVVFTFSPSFTTLSDTSSGAISTGEILTNGTSDTLLNLPRHHKDLIFTFIKNVDTDYPVAVKPDGDIIANLKPGEFMFAPVHIDGAGDASTDIQLAATTAAQKVQFLLCDGPNTGINSDD
tara:strand:+ start:687 stop:1112 length:426 start_codon:yes stop_codon:yes gene_type:complete